MKLFKELLLKIKNRDKIKILLHVGTPKTGTTSLQYFLFNNRVDLMKEGCLYPDTEDGFEKHQWMINALLTKDLSSFSNRLKEYFNSADESIHTIILSSEGIFNHWYDFPSESKVFLALLAKIFHIEILCCLRDQVSYTRSYYQQVLKNPQMLLVECYGKDISVDELLEDKWFKNHLNYYAFLEECSSIFGQKNIKLFEYSDDMIEDFLCYLGIKTEYKEKIRQNSSLSLSACLFLRIINRQNLSSSEKTIVLDNLYKIDAIIKKYKSIDIVDEKSFHKIAFMVKITNKLLKEKYNIDLRLK